MTHLYAIRCYAKHKYSIDTVLTDGRYVNQEAFFFYSEEAAVRRLSEILADEPNAAEWISPNKLRQRTAYLGRPCTHPTEHAPTAACTA
jgi:hypothetical protein